MSSGFVSEADLTETRKRRQEEWEKVRSADDPKDRPEEPYDGRSLFDRLKEQKLKKDMEYEEAHKLKNLIRGLDDDEVQFLEFVDKNKINAERTQMCEEESELKEFRNRVATLQEEYVDKKIQSEIKQYKVVGRNTHTSQKSLLSIGVKRKNSEVSSTSSSINKVFKNIPNTTTNKDSVILETISTNQFDKGEFKCIAVLPGIGLYAESSDSELSSDSEDEPDTQGKYDLVGRKQQKKKQCHEE